MFTPPSELAARLDPRVFDLRHAPTTRLGHTQPLAAASGLSRRRWLSAAAGLATAVADPAHAALVFNLDQEPADGPPAAQRANSAPAPAAAAQSPSAPNDTTALPEGLSSGTSREGLSLGEIPADFWQRPRELHLQLQRQGASERQRIVYWRDGALVPEGYWAACRMLRDVSANMMTYMDPAVMDILRGILGYYEAWGWAQPIVVNSGYRTPATNGKLLSEGAAKNSMHLYGKAVDLYMQGIPVEHLARLGLYFQKGGVGFYPPKGPHSRNGFVHLDTGRLRTWRG